jgi:tRNA dimethylallyltransferase
LDPRSDPLRGLRLRAIVGATGVGKSALALALARRHGLELVSLDSMQVYRGLDIGTAKPDAGERALAPHHMLDCADPRERYDASRFLGDLGRVLEGLAARGATPLFVGGTGFYLKLLVNGLAPDMPGDEGVRARLRERLALEGQERLHGELLRLDPPTALRIHPNDHYRLLRALEIHALTGNAPSALKTQWAAPARPARLVWLDCEVAELDARIRARAEAMFAAGWAAEARRLEEAGLLGPTASAALGYREAARVAARRGRRRHRLGDAPVRAPAAHLVAQVRCGPPRGGGGRAGLRAPVPSCGASTRVAWRRRVDWRRRSVRLNNTPAAAKGHGWGNSRSRRGTGSGGGGFARCRMSGCRASRAEGRRVRRSHELTAVDSLPA